VRHVAVSGSTFEAGILKMSGSEGHMKYLLGPEGCKYEGSSEISGTIYCRKKKSIYKLLEVISFRVRPSRLYAYCNISYVSVAVLPSFSQSLMQTRCSFNTATSQYNGGTNTIAL
jgi:hypothetical protein